MVLIILCEFYTSSCLHHFTDFPSIHAEQALELYENLFVVRPGGSFTGKWPPTEYALRRQAEQIEAARKILNAARTQDREIDADFEKQMALWKEHHNGERPTDEQLAEADLNSKTEWWDYFEAHDAIIEQGFVKADITPSAAGYDSEDDAGDAPLVIHPRSTGPITRLPARVDPVMSTPVPAIPMNPQVPYNAGLGPPPPSSSPIPDPFSPSFPSEMPTAAATSSPRKKDAPEEE